MQLKALTLATGLALSINAFADAPANPPAQAPAGDGKAVVRVDPNTPIARVNGTVLNALQLTLLREERAARGQPPQAGGDEYLRDALINSEILAQEAIKQGLDKDPVLLTALELNRKEILGRALVENHAGKNPVKDERIKAEYDRLKAKAGDTEYHARHILVDDEKLAKDLAAKLKAKKAKFEDLAKKHSKDSSAERGGDLGWMAPSNLVPEFALAMSALKKGETTPAPIKSRFGWHIIKLEETRPVSFPELDKVKGRIASQLMQNDIRQYVTELRSVAKVEVPTQTPPTGSPAPAAAATPATPAQPAK
jgi:peptidyl-prolyl cis-trans isomerase C